MIGKRLPDEPGWNHGRLNPGEYVKLDPAMMQDGTPLTPKLREVYPYWLVCTPNGHAGSLSKSWAITEHDDGTITVSPSIRISVGGGNGIPERELWHGFLQAGTWRDP